MGSMMVTLWQSNFGQFHAWFSQISTIYSAYFPAMFDSGNKNQPCLQVPEIFAPGPFQVGKNHVFFKAAADLLFPKFWSNIYYISSIFKSCSRKSREHPKFQLSNHWTFAYFREISGWPGVIWPQSGDTKKTRQDSQRLAAEVARLAQDCELQVKN